MTTYLRQWAAQQAGSTPERATTIQVANAVHLMDDDDGD